MSSNEVSATVVAHNATDVDVHASRIENLTKLLFIGGAEGVAEMLGRGITRRSGEDPVSFEERRARETLYRDMAKAISNADRMKVFDQLVKFASTNPGCGLDDPFDQQVAFNSHIINVSQLLQRIMRSAADNAFFLESLVERRQERQMAEDAKGLSPEEAMLALRGSEEDSHPEDSDDNTVVLSCRDLVKRERPADVVEALGALYNKLAQFSIGLQQNITGFSYEPRLLSLYSVSRIEDGGQVWSEAYTVEEARVAYHESRAKRLESRNQQKALTVASLGAIFK